jgi:RimJ/RimL family protein N-acetyltransferase
MLIGQLISLGPVIPADFPALFRWGNDVDSARLNEVYRPSDWNSHQEWWSNIGKDPSKVVFAIRKQRSNNILGFVQILNINGLHQSAHLGVRIGEPADRGHGYGREAASLAINYCWSHLNLGRIGLTVFKTNICSVFACFTSAIKHVISCFLLIAASCYICKSQSYH